MTLQEALKYDNLLKHNLMEKATTLNLSEETASQIMDQHVLVIPDDARSGMIFLGNESASYKLGNVRLNLKNAIAAGLELLAAVSIPDTFWNYLQLLISAAFFYSEIYETGSWKRRGVHTIFPTSAGLL